MTSYFINLIIETLWDMIPFGILLATVLIIFGFLGQIHSRSFTEGRELHTVQEELGEIYQLSLGNVEFGNDKFGFIEWGLFLVESFIILIMMVNLLIAVVSDTFDRVVATY